MNYDDESSKSFEEKFQGFLNHYEKMTEEDAISFTDKLQELIGQATELKNKEDKTPEEEKALKEMLPKLSELYARLTDFQLLLGEKMYRDAKTVHETIKQKAAEGDPAAIKAAKDLDESYRKMLDNNFGKN